MEAPEIRNCLKLHSYKVGESKFKLEDTIKRFWSYTFNHYQICNNVNDYCLFTEMILRFFNSTEDLVESRP